jgi:hypothetical protein
MNFKQDRNWKPHMLSLEQVQAVMTHHRSINMDFVISVFALCLVKKKGKTKLPMLSALRQHRNKLRQQI